MRLLKSPASDQLPLGSTEIYDSARRPHPFVEELLELWSHRELAALWTARNITLRYKRSVLGVLWTLIEPLMMTIILTVVFSTAFRFPMDNFPIYLLSGLLLFDYFSRSTIQVIEELIASGSLSQRIHVPRSAFALAANFAYLFNWLVALVPLCVFALVLGHPLKPAILVLPAGLFLTLLFCFGIGLLVATLGAFFHDFKLAYQVLLTAWFYCTPIIYPIEIIPEGARRYFELNPLYHLVSLVRDPVYVGTVPSVETWIYATLSSLFAAALGWWVFTHWSSALDYRV